MTLIHTKYTDDCSLMASDVTGWGEMVEKHTQHCVSLLIWLARQVSTRRRTASTAATLAEVTRVGCPAEVCLTRRQVSVPWGVKSTNSSRYNAQRDKRLSYCPLQCQTRQASQLLPSASSFGRPPRCVHFVNSTKIARKLTAPSAISQDLVKTEPAPSCVLASGATA